MNRLTLLFLFFFTTTSWALDIELPTETAVYRPSDLPGYALVQKNCIACHSAHYVTTQPSESSRSYWNMTVIKMKKSFGAPIDEKDIPEMADYLVKVYGNERPRADSLESYN